MSKVPLPVRDVLEEPVDDATIQQVWRGIESRRTVPSRRRHRQIFFAVSGAAMAAAAAVAIVYYPRSDSLVASPAAGAPLERIDGAELHLMAQHASASTSTRIALTDGSTITVHPGSRVESLVNTGLSFVAKLNHGSATFEVEPGGPRTWSVECGLATVEVVGTRFRIERERDAVTVTVERGIVLVRGERVPERVQRLIAGQSIEVRREVMAKASDPGEPLDGVAEVTEPAAEPATPPRARKAWRGDVERGDFRRAYERLGRDGIAQETRRAATVDELLRLADVARLSGHPADAVPPLTAITQQHEGDSRSALAAFTLGRVYLNTLRRPGKAARSFERAMDLGVPAGLREDVFARWVEALVRQGDRTGAREVAADYQRRFPNGRRSQEIQGLITP